MAKNGHFLQNRSKVPVSGAPGRGFYINPSRGRRARGPGPSGTLRDPPLGARAPGAGLRDPGIPGGPRTWSPGPPDRVPETPPGLPGAPRPLPRRGFYINPSRRGPAVPAGCSPEFLRRHVAWSHSWPPRALRVSYSGQYTAKGDFSSSFVFSIGRPKLSNACPLTSALGRLDA